MTVKVDGYTLDAICQYVNENYPQFLGVQPDNIVSFRVVDSFIVVLIDCGIKGTPKFMILADKLKDALRPVPEAKPKVKAINGRRKRGKK
jgi:hypothetical protein